MNGRQKFSYSPKSRDAAQPALRPRQPAPFLPCRTGERAGIGGGSRAEGAVIFTAALPKINVLTGFWRVTKFAIGALVALSAIAFGVHGALAETPSPSAPSKRMVAEFRLSPFYKKALNLKGFPVVASEKTSDYALMEAGYIVNSLLSGREDIRKALVKNRVRLAIMAVNELTTQIPEHSDLTPSKYWDKRARGLGATSERPAVSAAEENLLEFKGDPYKGENILVHEFAHAIHLMGLNTVDATFQSKLEKAYQSALQKGLWKGTYAATNPAEYWAEGVQSYFDCNQSPNHDHNNIKDRESLTRYDPELAALIASVFPNKAWRYEFPSLRKDPAHLKGYDGKEAPRFQWDADLVAWYKEYVKTHKE